MAHGLVEDSGMAYLEGTETPWHGMGNIVDVDANREQWREAAGLDWNVDRRPLFYEMPGETHEVATNKVLVRDDTQNHLGIVSNRYKVVQPKEVLDFIHDICDKNNFRMNTAGCLFGGKRIWAMADVGEGFDLVGGDRVNGFLLLSTSMDGSLPTTARFTTVRVVCNNTLQMANSRGSQSIKIPHSTTFNAAQVEVDLGLVHEQYASFQEQAELLASRKVDEQETEDWLTATFGDALTPEKRKNRTHVKIHDLLNGGAMGGSLTSADGTAWGLVNAATEFIDHHKQSQSDENRFQTAQWGLGAKTKELAFNNALALL